MWLISKALCYRKAGLSDWLWEVVFNPQALGNIISFLIWEILAITVENFYPFWKLCHFYLMECLGVLKEKNRGLQRMWIAFIIWMLWKGRSNQWIFIDSSNVRCHTKYLSAWNDLGYQSLQTHPCFAIARDELLETVPHFITKLSSFVWFKHICSLKTCYLNT